MGEKSEKATPKKLRDAKKKGQIAKSQDFPSAFTFIVSVSAVLWMIQSIFDQTGGFLVAAFSSVASQNVDRLITSFFMEGFMLIFLTSIPVMIVVSCVGMLVTVLIQGPVWAPEVFKPDIKKFNPIDNLKAKFKMKTVVELLKQLFKVSIAGLLVYFTVVKSLPILVQTVKMPIIGALAVYSTFLTEVIIKVGLFFIGVAIFDLSYQKYTFGKEMMMEKFEVKQEYKNTEGDPQIKGKRKQIAQEIAYSDGPMGGVRKAKAVITNPTHLAIALAYEREADPAPYITTMGDGLLAERIISLAHEFDIPVLRNIPLAHVLWDYGEIYNYVPEDAYGPVADIIRWLDSLEDEDGAPSKGVQAYDPESNQ